ncbi:cupin domain-containing protein [Pseudomonas putida]|uniref:cupin domain-containing protein n=1 Tax=Pseudomonas putida TaxID=303 RepID=UPI00226EFC37|nr:cupin domain-containing protein [Pseudomonas putida]WAB97136.1 cupin domain-containing protein [Pseudomonas putida]
MEFNITARLDDLQKLIQKRKMTLDNIRGLYDRTIDGITINSTQLKKIAQYLNVTAAYVIDELGGEYDKSQSCVFGGLIRFDRLRHVQGEPAYFYRHLLKTTSDKNLLVLRTTPLFPSAEKAILNAGHKAREFVYILSGTVGVKWGSHPHLHNEVLNEGDSIFIEEWTPHCFYKLEPDSQILAIDYL